MTRRVWVVLVVLALILAGGAAWAKSKKVTHRPKKAKVVSRKTTRTTTVTTVTTTVVPARPLPPRPKMVVLLDKQTDKEQTSAEIEKDFFSAIYAMGYDVITGPQVRQSAEKMGYYISADRYENGAQIANPALLDRTMLKKLARAFRSAAACGANYKVASKTIRQVFPPRALRKSETLIDLVITDQEVTLFDFKTDREHPWAVDADSVNTRWEGAGWTAVGLAMYTNNLGNGPTVNILGAGAMLYPWTHVIGNDNELERVSVLKGTEIVMGRCRDALWR